jgi:hypothetical protein
VKSARRSHWASKGAWHSRKNFSEWLTFTYAGVAERVSNVKHFGVTFDGGQDRDNNLVFLISPPNDGQSSNEILATSHLSSLNVTVPAPAISSAKSVARGNRTILFGEEDFFEVTGDNLIGRVIFDSGINGNIEVSTRHYYIPTSSENITLNGITVRVLYSEAKKINILCKNSQINWTDFPIENH